MLASPVMLLVGLGRLAREEVEAAIALDGLSLRHVSALGHLSREPGLSYSELGRRAGITAQSMQATVRHLEEAGMVERVSAAGRGRAAQLRVTSKGVEAVRRTEDRVTAAEGRLLGELEPEDRRALALLLQRAFLSMRRARVGA